MPGIIELTYLKGIVPHSELNSIRTQLEKYKIDFKSKDISGEPQASLEELLAPIILYISSDVIKDYLLGLSTAISYDMLKSIIIGFWKHVSGKTIEKITQSEVKCSEVDFRFRYQNFRRNKSQV